MIFFGSQASSWKGIAVPQDRLGQGVLCPLARVFPWRTRASWAPPPPFVCAYVCFLGWLGGWGRHCRRGNIEVSKGGKSQGPFCKMMCLPLDAFAAIGQNLPPAGNNEPSKHRNASHIFSLTVLLHPLTTYEFHTCIIR